MFPQGVDLGYTFLTGVPHHHSCDGVFFSLRPIKRHMMSLRPSMGDVGFDPLAKAASVEDEGRSFVCLGEPVPLMSIIRKDSANMMRHFLVPQISWP